MKFHQPELIFFLLHVESELGHSACSDFFFLHALSHTAITSLDLDHSHRRFSILIF